MKKIFVIISIFLVILTGLIYFIPVTAMGSMSGIMVGHQNDCLNHCLKAGSIEIQNSVTIPLVISIIIGIIAISFIIFFSKVTRIEYKIDIFDRLYLFKTVNLRE